MQAFNKKENVDESSRGAHAAHSSSRGARRATWRSIDFGSEKGIAVLAALIAVFLLGTMGAGAAYFASSNQSVIIQQISSDQSFYSNHGGMEFALKQIADGFGGVRLVRNYSGELITVKRVNSQVSTTTTEAEAAANHSITDPDPPEPCLQADVSSAYLAVGGLRIEQIYLSRKNIANCTFDIATNALSGTTWTPDGGQKLKRVNIGGGGNEFNVNNANAVSSGGAVVFGNSYLISDYNNHEINEILWTGDLSTADQVDLDIHHTYDEVDFVLEANIPLTGSHADCFTLDDSGGELSTVLGEYRKVIGVTTQNTCGFSIEVDKIQPSWTPATPTVNMTDFKLGGDWLVNGGSVPTGQEVNVTNKIISGGSSAGIDEITFADSILGRNYSILWTFADGTIKTTPIDIFNANQANCLTVDVSNAAIAGNGQNDKKEIQGLGIDVDNSCTKDIGLDGMTVSWVPLSPTNNLKEIKIGNSALFSGTSASGVANNFDDTDDVYIRNEDASAITINRILFQNQISKCHTITLQFNMSDGNNKSVALFGTPGVMQNITVDTSSASIGGSGNVDLLGVVLRNNSASVSPTVNSIEFDWVRNTSRCLQQMQVKIFGATNFIAFGQWPYYPGVPLCDGQKKNTRAFTIYATTYGASSVVPVNYARFNGSMNNSDFELRFYASDGSCTEGFADP